MATLEVISKEESQKENEKLETVLYYLPAMTWFILWLATLICASLVYHKNKNTPDKSFWGGGVATAFFLGPWYWVQYGVGKHRNPTRLLHDPWKR
jgi:Trk-type K+ transport system membrane component